MTPSCVSACMTQLNIDYKYFAGSKDPIEIINKYRMRGFGTILNKNEITRLIEYSNLVPKWKNMLSLDIKSNLSVLKILGELDLDHGLFHPSGTSNTDKYMKIGKYKFKVIIDSLNLIEAITYLYNTSNISDHLNLTKFITINNHGYVEPVKKWLLNAFADPEYNTFNE